MTTYKLIYFILVIYISLITGIFVKFKRKGVRGLKLLFLPMIMPVLILYIIVEDSLRELLKKEGTFGEKLKKAWSDIKLGFLLFPTIIGVVGAAIAKPVLNEIKIRNRKPTLSFKLKVMFHKISSCYSITFDEETSNGRLRFGIN